MRITLVLGLVLLGLLSGCVYHGGVGGYAGDVYLSGEFWIPLPLFFYYDYGGYHHHRHYHRYHHHPYYGPPRVYRPAPPYFGPRDRPYPAPRNYGHNLD